MRLKIFNASHIEIESFSISNDRGINDFNYVCKSLENELKKGMYNTVMLFDDNNKIVSSKTVVGK